MFHGSLKKCGILTWNSMSMTGEESQRTATGESVLTRTVACWSVSQGSWSHHNLNALLWTAPLRIGFLGPWCPCRRTIELWHLSAARKQKIRVPAGYRGCQGHIPCVPYMVVTMLCWYHGCGGWMFVFVRVSSKCKCGLNARVCTVI